MIWALIYMIQILYTSYKNLINNIACLMLIIISLFIISGCGPIKDSYIYDYYAEYRFELPFDHTISNATSELYFNAEYSIEQMCELINDAGYNADLYNNGNVKTILTSIEKDEFTYYFVIYDKNYFEDSTVYTLSNAASSFYSYVFLAPVHILDNTRRVYGSFEHIADFYRSTGKNDVEIDDINKTITFQCEGNPNLSWKKGSVFIQYIETETGNYLNIEIPMKK